MGSILQDVFHLFGIPAVWGGILTITTIAMGIFLKQLVSHTLAAQLEKIKDIQRRESFLRDLYAEGIKTYSSQQSQALRQVYLMLFEDRKDGDLQQQVDDADRVLMKPLRDHSGILDKDTEARIFSVHNKLLDFKRLGVDDLKREKIDFFNLTKMAEHFVKADQIAFRLGLIDRTLDKRSANEI